jgi:predicted O-methyltransferase YrrM
MGAARRSVRIACQWAGCAPSGLTYPRQVPKLQKIVRAIRAAARDPRGLAKDVARLPLEREAAALISTLPVVELSDLTGDTARASVSVPPRSTRHDWSLGTAEQIVLQLLVRVRGCRTAFELGTFNGATTRVIAEALPSDGKVWTLDLPEAQFDATQRPPGMDARGVGAAYRSSPAASKIIQLFGDSLDFDFAPYAWSADLVLVDAGHEYANGLADTNTALGIVRSGGIILWDDFTPYWHGLVRGICDAMDGRPFGRLAGTALATYESD